MYTSAGYIQRWHVTVRKLTASPIPDTHAPRFQQNSCVLSKYTASPTLTNYRPDNESEKVNSTEAGKYSILHCHFHCRLMVNILKITTEAIFRYFPYILHI